MVALATIGHRSAVPAAQSILEQPLEVDRMMLVAPVLHNLQPVARQHVADDLPQAVFLL
jgi:hypothetical protein